MIYLFLATKRERILCCRRNRARAFIALDCRHLRVLMSGVGCLSFFKATILKLVLDYLDEGSMGRDARVRGNS
ncbi:MAG: hypothetical protein LC775_19760 [Acidobacteria bacterium]|nr:hypothetical protein [Acidobacteriota bacterium]